MQILDLRNNELSDLKSYIPLAQTQSSNFYSIGQQVMDISSVDSTGEIINIKITLDWNYSSIQRTVYSFMDLVGQIGGISQIWVVAGVVVTSLFVNKVYMESLLSNLFRVAKRSSILESELKILPKNKGEHRDLKFRSEINRNQLDCSEYVSNVRMKIEGQQLSEVSENVIKCIKEQNNYSFSWKTIILSVLKFLNFKCLRKYREWSYKQKVYENGWLKVNSELDIVSL